MGRCRNSRCGSLRRDTRSAICMTALDTCSPVTRKTSLRCAIAIAIADRFKMTKLAFDELSAFEQPS